jgi:hypothetical protein
MILKINGKKINLNTIYKMMKQEIRISNAKSLIR